MSIIGNNNIIQFKKVNCKNCFKCLRECSVKAIAFRDGQAEIIKDQCLVCGHCLTVCPQNAKVVRSDIEVVKDLFNNNKKVIASIAPSFVAAFKTDFTTFRNELKKLGFYDVYETAVGASKVTDEYRQLIKSHKYPLLISSACPTIVKFVEKYYPSSLPFLTPVDSPMIAHAKLIKKNIEDAYVVFIGPCISKKDEASWDDSVDVALTFEELNQWLDNENIEEESLSTVPISTIKNDKVIENGKMYPTKGGILKTLNSNVAGVSYMTVEGIDDCKNILESLKTNNYEGYFIEMSACNGSCLNGPCMIKENNSYLSSFKSVENYLLTSNPCKSSDFDWQGIDLNREFKVNISTNRYPGEQEIKNILAQTGKLTKEQELNCGACGYPTCREKAVAVYQGKAEVTMCMPYMRERAEMISDKVIAYSPNAIIVLNELLSITALNSSACKLFGINDSKKYAGKYIGELTDATYFEQALVSRQSVLNQKCYLFRYEKYVEQSVIFVKEHNMIFATLRDLTETEKQNENLKKVKLETIGTADNVIEKQMRVVQEIAMLLGETTAETKVALTKLKETIISEEE